VLTTERADPTRLEALRKKVQDVHICGKTEIDFKKALRWLKKKWRVNKLLCEGGGELNDAMFRAGLVDELHLTICPTIFGGRRAPTLAEGHWQPKLAEATSLKLKSFRRVGDELFLVYRTV
jgi:riboflavin-specific deaminase-like protein